MTRGHYARLSRRRKVDTIIDHRRVIQLYHERWSIRAIAYELDAVYSTIRDILIHHGVALRGPNEPCAVNVSYNDYMKARHALARGDDPPPKLGSVNTPEIERLRAAIGWDPSWIDWAKDSSWDMEEAT